MVTMIVTVVVLVVVVVTAVVTVRVGATDFICHAQQTQIQPHDLGFPDP